MTNKRDVMPSSSADQVADTPTNKRCLDDLGAQLDAMLVGTSAEMQKLRRLIVTLARNGHPVLIEGESGTGKEVVARAIHFCGPRQSSPFIPVDCGAIVATLMETELFGHAPGAFTGAVGSKDGLLVVARDGTIFLDEVGELPADLQPKLLRALQEREIRPVGGNRSVRINARIVAASNRDLKSAAQEGTFRKDLYFRLNGVHLRVPPLRERKDDVPLLVTHFLEKIASIDNVRWAVSDEAMRVLLEYHWPGNIRELEHCLEHATVVASGTLLRISDLPASVSLCVRSDRISQRDAGIIPIAELQKRAILAAIDHANGDKQEAARMLGISKTTLYRKLRDWESQQ